MTEARTALYGRSRMSTRRRFGGTQAAVALASAVAVGAPLARAAAPALAAPSRAPHPQFESGLFLDLPDFGDGDDVEVPAGASTLTVAGSTIPDADVSVDDDFVDLDDDGTFAVDVPLDEVTEIQIVASDADGNVVERTLLVTHAEPLDDANN